MQEERAVQCRALEIGDWVLADQRAAEWMSENPDGKDRMSFETAPRARL